MSTILSALCYLPYHFWDLKNLKTMFPMRKATNWSHSVYQLLTKFSKTSLILLLLLNNSNYLRPLRYIFNGNLFVYPTNLFLFFFNSCPCVFTEQWTERHKRLKRLVCALSVGVSVSGTLKLKCHALLASRPVGYFTQWMGPTPTLQTEFGWYLCTLGMVYYGDSSK